MSTENYSIYRITNPTGKVYIGQSKNPKDRIRSYKWCKPDQNAIYNSLQKYGYDAHEFEILISGLDKETVDIVEIGLIKIYKVHSIEVLNIAEGGSSNKIPSKMKPVVKFSLDGDYICEYESISEASRDNNISIQSISPVLRKKKGCAGLYLWLYKHDYENGIKPTPVKVTKGRPFYAFDLNGNFIKEYRSMLIASNETNTDSKMIRQNLLGKRSRVKDFQFSFNKNVAPYQKKIILQYDLENNLMNTFTTLQEASEELNISKGTVKAKLRYEDNDFTRMTFKYKLTYSRMDSKLSKS